MDHPKIMEALKQLGNLASRMNECKRRKELSKLSFYKFLNLKIFCSKISRKSTIDFGRKTFTY